MMIKLRILKIFLRRIIFFLGVAGVSIFGLGCSSFNLKEKIKEPQDSHVELLQDMYIKKSSGEVELKHKGEKIKLEKGPTLFEFPGHIGMVVVPGTDSPTEFKLGLRELPHWGGSHVDRYANQVIAEILSDITDAQIFLGQKRAKQALEIVQKLQIKYPKITYLYFLESSCLFVMGDTQKAKAVLNKALEDFPNNKQGKDLSRILAGESQ